MDNFYANNSTSPQNKPFRELPGHIYVDTGNERLKRRQAV